MNNELPAWDISTEYPSIESEKFKNDFTQVDQGLNNLESMAADLITIKSGNELSGSELKAITLMMGKMLETRMTLYNMVAYLHCLISVDGKNAEAVRMDSVLQQRTTRLAKSTLELEEIITYLPKDSTSKLLQLPEIKEFSFFIKNLQKLKPVLLSKVERGLLAELSVSGHNSWEDLYYKIIATAKTEVELNGKKELIGAPKAIALTKLVDPEVRKKGYEADQRIWETHAETAAAIVNSLAKWRLSFYKQSSHTQNVDHLFYPMYQDRINSETLNCLMSVLRKNKEKMQKGMRLLAKSRGFKQLHPADLDAPSPFASNQKYTFQQAVNAIKSAFGEETQELADFVQLAVDKQWIEARVLPNKTGGAFCTYFAKTGEPRVLQTFMGSPYDIRTLAHELGHAFHTWCLKAVSPIERGYPSTLAETASTFAENVLLEYTARQSSDTKDKLNYYYLKTAEASAYLLNIPLRFEFEDQLHIRRQESVLSIEELNEMMDKSWRDWYGDTISETNKHFWASKLHFSIAGSSFYNYSYSFGYLLSKKIASFKEKQQDKFFENYKNFLRDTGRMTCEEIIQKHFGESIQTEKFWQEPVDAIVKEIDEFEVLLQSHYQTH